MRVLILLISLVLVSCGPSREEIEAKEAETLKLSKHKPGDIIHLKPDSAKAVIISVEASSNCFCGDPKTVNYKVRDMKGSTDIIPEALVFEY